MSVVKPNLKRIQTILNNQIIPWLKADNAVPFVFMDPPLDRVQGVRMLPPEPPLKLPAQTSNSGLFQHNWLEEKMASVRFVTLGCVLQGEIDYTVSHDTSVFQRMEHRSRTRCMQSMTLQEGTFFLVPSWIARPTDGPHCNPPHTEPSNSLVFWMLIAPDCFLCHTCSTRRGKHISSQEFVFRDPYLNELSQLMVEEFCRRSIHWENITRSLLLITVLRVARSLAEGTMLPVFPGWHSIRAEVVTPDVFANQLPEASELVQRVCRYIQQHVAEPLSLTTLAARAAVSQPHLSRQFREQLGITVMGYVTCCRISLAQYYLSSPASQDLTVREIGELVGFVDSSYFSRVFKSLEGISPHQFRHKRGGASAPPD